MTPFFEFPYFRITKSICIGMPMRFYIGLMIMFYLHTLLVKRQIRESLITAQDANFLNVYRQSLDTSIEEHVPSKKMRPREKLRNGL